MAGTSGGPGQQLADMRLMYYEDCDEINQETETLSGVVRRQSKYGSLALKYSVTMEQIRRANRMYTSDSLFCKSVLSIPVPVPVHDSSPASSLTYTDLVPEAVVVVTTNDHLPVTNDSHLNTDKGQQQQTHPHHHHHRRANSHKKNREDQSPEISNSPETQCILQMDDPCSISLTKMNGKDPPASIRKKKVIINENAANVTPEETAYDFLHRIDSSIAKTRDQVEKKVTAAGVSYSYSENDLFSLNQPGPSAAASVSRSRSARFKTPSNDSSVINGDSQELPACYIRTKDNKVRYSMRKLEQEQDELFQL